MDNVSLTNLSSPTVSDITFAFQSFIYHVLAVLPPKFPWLSLFILMVWRY